MPQDRYTIHLFRFDNSYQVKSSPGMNGNLGKKRLLLIGLLPPPVGGVAAIYESLIDSNLSDIFDLRILNISSGNSRKALRNRGRFSIGKIFKTFFLLARLVRTLLRWRPHAIYLSFNSTRWAGYRDSLFIRTAHSFGVKIVIRFENCRLVDYYENGSKRRKRRIVRTFGLVDSIHVGNPHMKKSISNVLPKNKIVAFPTGIDGSALSAIAAERENRNPTGKILFLGNLIVEKGIMELIEAFDVVAAAEPECELTLAGPWVGKDKQRIIERIDRSPFKSGIHLPGVVSGEAKLDLFREADVFIMPTHLQEGCSSALIEASAAGLPVITCEVGGIPSTIRHGKGGFFVPVGGIDEIVESTKILFHNKALYRRFSRFNVRRFKRLFQKDKFIHNVGTNILEVCDSDHRV
jgi:glycosyltransferase involved in cell wall biosynthesis